MITQRCDEGGQRLDAAQLEAVLLQAMPERQQLIKATCAKVNSNYQPNGGNADFLTQLLNLKIEKDVAAVYEQPRIAPSPLRDPLTASVVLDPRAQAVLLFNARDVDHKGRPLLMKVIAREGTDLSKLDLSGHRTERPDGALDVQWVGKNAAYAELKDTDEHEFAFGDSVIHASLDAKSREIGRGVVTRPENERNTHFYYARTNADGERVPDTTRRAVRHAVATGPELDTTPVSTFDDRIGVALRSKGTALGSEWIDSPMSLFDAELNVDPGLLYEPGGLARVTVGGTRLTTEVAEDEALLLGSPGTSAKLESDEGWTLRDFLTQPLTRTVMGPTRSAGDRAERKWLLKERVFDRIEDVQIGGRQWRPFRDVRLEGAALAASGITASYGDGGKSVEINLPEGLVAAKIGGSVKGWSIVAGYTDPGGKWHSAAPIEVTSKRGSAKATVTLDVEDLAELMRTNAKLEVRLSNEDGVPAQRLLLDSRAVGWGASGVNVTAAPPNGPSGLENLPDGDYNFDMAGAGTGSTRLIGNIRKRDGVIEVPFRPRGASNPVWCPVKADGTFHAERAGRFGESIDGRVRLEDGVLHSELIHRLRSSSRGALPATYSVYRGGLDVSTGEELANQWNTASVDYELLVGLPGQTPRALEGKLFQSDDGETYLILEPAMQVPLKVESDGRVHHDFIDAGDASYSATGRVDPATNRLELTLTLDGVTSTVTGFLPDDVAID